MKTRVRNLESKLAQSVLKTELESRKATLQVQIGDLEASLARSVPKEEDDTLRVRSREELKLAGSIPRREAEAEPDTAGSKLRGEIEQLKEKLAASLPKVEVQAAKYEGDLKGIGRILGSDVSNIIPRLPVGDSIFHLVDVGDQFVLA